MTKSTGPHARASATSLLAGVDEYGDASRFVVLATPEGWQLLLELGPRYLRWLLRGEPGNEGQALPAADVSSHSLEAEDGSLHKHALEREGNTIGIFHNLRERDGELVPLGECLEDGVFELLFEGEPMDGRWRLSRSGSARRRAETWTLLRTPSE